MTKQERLEMIKSICNRRGAAESPNARNDEPDVIPAPAPVAEMPAPVAETNETVFDPSLDSVSDPTGLVAMMEEIEREIASLENSFKISDEDWDNVEGERQAKIKELEKIQNGG